MSSFFGARYLMLKYHWLIRCRLWKEVLLISFLVYGKSVVRNFEQKLRFFIKIFFKKLQNTIRFVIIRHINYFMRQSYFLKHLPETILKLTETSRKKSRFWKKTCKTFIYRKYYYHHLLFFFWKKKQFFFDILWQKKSLKVSFVLTF